MILNALSAAVAPTALWIVEYDLRFSWDLIQIPKARQVIKASGT